MRSPGRTALALTAATRLPVLALGAIAVSIVGSTSASNVQSVWRVSANELADLLARWDTYWYNSIATTGYHWDPALPHHQNVVFFPLYPLLMRWIGRAIGGHPLIAGLIVSLAAFAGAAAILYRLAALDVAEARARNGVLLLAVFPFALYFSVVYTESLFLLLMAAAFLAMRRERFAVSALCGFLAGLARPNGCWLSISLGLLSLERTGSRRMAGLAAAAAPIAGLAVYCAYLWYRFGDPLAWMHGQAAWGFALAGRRSILEPGETPGPPSAVDVVVWTGDIITFAWAMWSAPRIYRRFGAAYASLIVLTLVPPVLTHLFMSNGRFASVLFPLFFQLAEDVPESRVRRLAAAFAAVQAAFAIGFFLWWPVV